AQFIAELASVQHHEPELVTRTLGYIAAAKNGLSAKELTEILSRDANVIRAISSERHEAMTNKLPPSVWIRLSRQLAPFLVEKRIDDQPLMQFFHRQVADVAHRHYDLAKMEFHVALAAYFDCPAALADGEAGKSGRSGNVIYSKRSLSELPYQL